MTYVSLDTNVDSSVLDGCISRFIGFKVDSSNAKLFHKNPLLDPISSNISSNLSSLMVPSVKAIGWKQYIQQHSQSLLLAAVGKWNWKMIAGLSPSGITSGGLIAGLQHLTAKETTSYLLYQMAGISACALLAYYYLPDSTKIEVNRRAMQGLNLAYAGIGACAFWTYHLLLENARQEFSGRAAQGFQYIYDNATYYLPNNPTK